ncbi:MULTISPECIES: hypothetical protein [Myroides]|uniref:hypothetical protein n=1 Tax=Myroides TaxID=76831 RepID=UPI00114706BC|nr:hypothetical protein [Myroides injenensis]
MKNIIHWNYLLKHWASTLLIAPFIVQILMYISKNNAHQIVGLLEVYPITLIVSVVFSLPTYVIYGIIDYFAIKNSVSEKTNKYILICTALVGILFTFLILFKTNQLEIILGYGITSVFFGIILKLSGNNT